MHIERILAALDELVPERIAGMSPRYRNEVLVRARTLVCLCDPILHVAARSGAVPMDGILAELHAGNPAD
jgi:hypothetical protein